MFSCGIVSTSLRAWNNVVQKGGHKILFLILPSVVFIAGRPVGSTRETGILAYERRGRVLHAVANCSDCLFANLFLAETVLVLSIHCRGIIDLTTRLNFNQSTLPLIDHKNRKRIL